MLSDWISVLQLSAAISVAFGAYDATRLKREEKCREMLDNAEIKIRSLLPEDTNLWTYKVPKETMLDTVDWVDMSNADLNLYRRDIRVRFETTIATFRKHDRLRTLCFLGSGFLAVTLLIVSSAFPRTEINTFIGVLCAVILLGLPIASILSILLEELHLTRLISPNDPPSSHDRGRKIPPRSNVRKGQFYHVLNEIRRR